MIKETKLRRDIKDFLFKIGCEYVHVKESGYPDILVIPPSTRMFFIETKRSIKSSYQLTDEQKETIKKLRVMGHEVLVIRSEDDWEKQITNLT